MLNATRQFTVTAVDVGVKPSVASAIAKYHLTEKSRIALNHAMDVHAGRAIISGPNNYMSIGYNTMPVSITVEGANILTRNLMIFGQGAMRCHPFIRAEYESLSSDNGLYEFDKSIFGHMGYMSQNKLRSIFHAFTGGKLATGYNSKFKRYYKQITRMSSAFAYVSDVALIILGGELKRKERLSARLGDVMSYLYMACSSLKYFKDNNERVSDEVFLTWTLDHCLFNAQTALLEVLDNFPNKVIAKMLKAVLFPYGKPYKKPSDKLEADLVHSLVSNSETREVFRSMCYVPDDYNDIAGRIETTFKAVLQTAPIKAKIYKAVRAKQLPKASAKDLVKRALELEIITSDEFEAVTQSAKYVNEVIQVDEFGPFEFGAKNAHPDWK